MQAAAVGEPFGAADGVAEILVEQPDGRGRVYIFGRVQPGSCVDARLFTNDSRFLAPAGVDDTGAGDMFHKMSAKLTPGCTVRMALVGRGCALNVGGKWLLLNRMPSKLSEGPFLVRVASEWFKVGRVRFAPMQSRPARAPGRSQDRTDSVPREGDRPMEQRRSAGEGFFTVAEINGRWLFVAPSGERFFSIGMNHIDSASLRYPEHITIWRERYGNSQERWLRERVRPDLLDWGFNTVGWAQEVVTRGETNHRHSRCFTFEEYQWLGMPYCHLLPFAEIHQWEVETLYPDVFAPEFEEWCDHVAREHCAVMAEDPKLIGYFYSDCPTWIHPSHNPARKGAWFEDGSPELARTAERYYRVTHDAIRRYDPSHLILGDRYEANRPLSETVIRAAAETVDVLSFQFFATADRIAAEFGRWRQLTGLPMLLADACTPQRDTSAYPEMLSAVRRLDCCVGWHYCGAYVRNRCRRAGFRNEDDTLNEAMVEPVRAANLAAAAEQ